MSAHVPVDFEQLFSRSPNPYMVLDRALSIVWMNQAYLDTTMSERDAIIGRGMFEAFPSDPESDSFKLLDKSIRRAFATGEVDELALIRYDLRTPDGTLAEMYWSATHTPIRTADGAVAFVLQHTVDVTELHTLRQLRDGAGLVQRAGAVQARNADLLVESRKLRNMFDQAPGFMAMVSGPDHVFTMTNAAYARLTAQRDIVGRPVRSAIPEVVEQGFTAILDTVRTEGRPYVGEREPVQLQKEGSEETETRFLNFIFQPVFDEGKVSGIFIQGHDVTDEVEAFEAQRLLINELNHRVKNTLAVVQGLAAQSFRSVPGAEGARRTFDARLHALAAAHSLLTQNNWDFAQVSDVVKSAVEATAGSDIERFIINGPNISLPPQTAVSLAMIVHELSANAIKYGALSDDAGRVSVTWNVEEQPRGELLTLDWRESGGPVVIEPTRRGFGSRLIERGLSAESGSDVTIEYPASGLHCRIATHLEGMR